MKVTCIIFDMDGVIIDSEPQWAKAQIAALAKLGINITEQDCEKLTRGRRIDQIAKIWIKNFNLQNIDEKALAKVILENAYHAILEEGKAQQGLYELLDFLKHRQFRLALATSSSPIVIKAVFDKLNLWDYFEFQCSADDEPYGKPHPAVYLTAMQKLGVSPSECIVIEDSVTGLIAAKAATLRTFIVNPNFEQPYFSLADQRMATLFDVIHHLP